MLTIPKKRSLTDMQHPDHHVPEELNDRDYLSEVLQLEDGRNEASIDEELASKVAALGIDVTTATMLDKSLASISDSAETLASRHARTGSTGSQVSISTAMTSRSSNEQLEEQNSLVHLPQKRGSLQQTLPISEYEKFLKLAEKQQLVTSSSNIPSTVEPAPSLHSVSTKKSNNSFRNSFKDRFRSRKKRLSDGNLNICFSCGDDSEETKASYTLSCSHKYCEKCLRAMIQQTTREGSKKPPKCCNIPIPLPILESLNWREQPLSPSSTVSEEKEVKQPPKAGVTSVVPEETKKIAQKIILEPIMTVEMQEAIARTRENEEMKALRASQINERDRFCGFERKMKWLMWTRHGQLKLDVLEQYGDLEVKMKERHAKSVAQLEDRQVAAEMDLRAALKQSERSVHIRLRHMEAYCKGLGRTSSGSNPTRVVTERDLRELGQQYNLRDNMEHLHQSKINVLREKQAKQMDELLTRHEGELENLGTKQNEELDALEESFGAEEDQFHNLFTERKTRLRRRWHMAAELVRKRLETESGLKFAEAEEVGWPTPQERTEELEAVTE